MFYLYYCQVQFWTLCCNNSLHAQCELISRTLFSLSLKLLDKSGHVGLKLHSQKRKLNLEGGKNAYVLTYKSLGRQGWLRLSNYRNKGTVRNGQTAQHRDFFFLIQRRAEKLQQTELGHLWEETLASIRLFILNILICSTQMPFLSSVQYQYTASKCMAAHWHGCHPEMAQWQGLPLLYLYIWLLFNICVC